MVLRNSNLIESLKDIGLGHLRSGALMVDADEFKSVLHLYPHQRVTCCREPNGVFRYLTVLFDQTVVTESDRPLNFGRLIRVVNADWILPLHQAA